MTHNFTKWFRCCYQKPISCCYLILQQVRTWNVESFVTVCAIGYTKNWNNIVQRENENSPRDPVSFAAVIRVGTLRFSPTGICEMLWLANLREKMGFEFKQPLVGEKRCVTTLITAAKETTRDLDCKYASRISAAKQMFIHLESLLWWSMFKPSNLCA